MTARQDPSRMREALVRQSHLSDESASQIVEFAVSLPLLVVFVVGIFDFSGAFTLKQKLANAAWEGARVAAADPATDLGNSFGKGAEPVSVSDAFQVIDSYLISEQINDCGLLGSGASSQANLKWTYTAKGNGCPGTGVQIIIDRGCAQAVPSTPVKAVGTCVTVSYPYKWRFNSVIILLVPATYQGLTYLSSTAAAFNEN